MEEHISSIIFLPTAKRIWDLLHELYYHKKYISRVFEQYEQLVSLQQGELSITELYTTLHVVMDELDIHQLLVLDEVKLKEYHEGVYVCYSSRSQ